MQPTRIAAAGAIVFDESHRLLVVRRARPPAAGQWSIPGGKALPGEASAAACVREVHEETGLVVETIGLAGQVVRDAPGGAVFDIDDYVCSVVGGALRAGSDASDARWVTCAQLIELDLVAGLLAALTEWNALPR